PRGAWGGSPGGVPPGGETLPWGAPGRAGGGGPPPADAPEDPRRGGGPKLIPRLWTVDGFSRLFGNALQQQLLPAGPVLTNWPFPEIPRDSLAGLCLEGWRAASVGSSDAPGEVAPPPGVPPELPAWIDEHRGPLAGRAGAPAPPRLREITEVEVLARHQLGFAAGRLHVACAALQLAPGDPVPERSVDRALATLRQALGRQTGWLLASKHPASRAADANSHIAEALLRRWGGQDPLT